MVDEFHFVLDAVECCVPKRKCSSSIFLLTVAMLVFFLALHSAFRIGSINYSHFIFSSAAILILKLVTSFPEAYLEPSRTSTIERFCESS